MKKTSADRSDHQDSDSGGEDSVQKQKQRLKKKEQKSVPPTESMSEIKLRVQGFRDEKTDSTTYKAKPARY